jgi:hypothetical protein
LPTKLRVGDQDDALVQVEIGDGEEPQSLTDPHPGDCHHPDQRLHRGRTQRGEQLLGRPHHGLDVGVGEQMRRGPPGAAGALPDPWHADRQAGPGEIDRELSDRGQPVGQPRRSRPHARVRPGQRLALGEQSAVEAVRRQGVDKLDEQTLEFPVRLEAARLSEGQVLADQA